MNFAKRLTLEWIGIIGLTLSALVVACTILFQWPKKLDLRPVRTTNIQTTQEASFTWSLKDWSPLPSSAQIREQLLFSMAPPRPDCQNPTPLLSIHLLRAGVAEPIQLPAKIGLAWGGDGILCLGDSHSLFWLDIVDAQATLCTQSPQDGTILRESWTIEPTSVPLQSSFAEKSCFRPLAETKWIPDVVSEHFSQGAPVYRTETFGLAADGWLSYRNDSWQPLATLDQSEGRPIAHLIQRPGGSLEIEGWEGDRYVRFPAQLGSSLPLRLRPEELIPQLRIRSETQVSCTLDKQCLVLHVGDWAIKRDQRWMIVRKPEEKQRLLEEALPGDLFCLEQIDPARSITAHYFAANRMQHMLVERTVERRTRTKK